MSETPGSPEYYTPPPQALPTPPPPPMIGDAAAQYDNPYLAAPGQRTPPSDPQLGVYYPTTPRPAQGLAITALVLGIIAIVTGWIPGWGIVVGLAAVVFGIFALVKRQSKGMAISGLVTGAIGAVFSVGMLALVIFSANWASDPDNWFISADPDEFFTGGATTLGAEPVDGGVYVAERAFGPTEWDDSIWWYVVIVDNPGATSYVASDMTVKALDASGAEIDSEWSYASLPSGRTAITGLLYEVGDAEVANLAVVGPSPDTLQASSAEGTIETSNVEDVTDEYLTTVTGTATSTYQDELFGAEIVVVARDEAGTIIASAPAYLDPLQSGESAQFQAYFDTALPPGTTYETYAVTY